MDQVVELERVDLAGVLGSVSRADMLEQPRELSLVIVTKAARRGRRAALGFGPGEG